VLFASAGMVPNPASSSPAASPAQARPMRCTAVPARLCAWQGMVLFSPHPQSACGKPLSGRGGSLRNGPGSHRPPPGTGQAAFTGHSGASWHGPGRASAWQRQAPSRVQRGPAERDPT
jgi:hypothetical protein